MSSKSYRENYKLIKWSPIKVTQRTEEEKGKASYFMPDIAEFIAPGGVQIGSRSKLREYEKRTGTKQCGELKRPEEYGQANNPQPNKAAIDRAYRKTLEQKGLI